MLGGSFFYSYFTTLIVLASLVYFVLIFERQRASNRRSTAKADTPSRSLSPTSKKGENFEQRTNEKSIPLTKEAIAPAGIPFKSPPLPDVPTREKPSIMAFITNLLPSRRGPIVSSSSTAASETSSGRLSLVNRSVEEIKGFGDFPDYATLSGVRLPDPYSEFTIEKALPRPYRPFRWMYHQTMAFWKMEPDWWLELENTYVERIRQRKELFALHGKAILDSLPGSEAACKESMEMCLQFLAARYPQYFSLVSTTPTLAPDLFINKILDKEFRIREIDPLMVILENVPEDFAITLQDTETGLYIFKAGIICSSIGWNLGTKIGMTLAEIHAPVPEYKEKLKFSLNRFFTKLLPNAPIQRGSWGLEVGQPLFMPLGDPHELHRLSQDPELPLSEIHLRVDWQTLRRLPLSGAILFNFKALFTPISEFRDEPGIPQIVAKILREGKKNLMDYKGTWHVQHVVLPTLDKWNEEQVQSGLVEKEWQVATLEDSPWFKGWKEKWQRQQGF